MPEAAHSAGGGVNEENVGPVQLACWYPQEYARLMPCGRGGDGQADAAPEGDQDGKWWRDDCEPLYCVVAGRAISIGRPCDTDDRVNWLLQQRHFQAAMQAAVSARYVSPATWRTCSSTFLAHLLETSDFAGAAAWAARLLGNDRDAWEHLVFAFAARKQLPALGAHVPTEAPTLSRTAYLMVASSFLAAREHHARLLELLRSWPHAVLSNIAAELAQAVTQQIARFPSAQLLDLQRCLAFLLRLQGHHLQALEVFLRIRDPGVFAYVTRFHLHAAAARHAPQLADVDEDAAAALFVAQREAAPAQAVAAELVRSLRAAERSRDSERVHVARRRLFKYLHALFAQERAAPHSYHDLQVDLYAEFAPDDLLAFLQSSRHYHMDRALAVCQRAGLTREQVFLLGRMSRASEALRLIVLELRDLPQATAFVSAQGDEALWDELILLAASSPAFAGELLDQVGGHVDPLRLMQAIPDDLPIARLNERLTAVIRRFRTSVQLKQQCNDIVDADCMLLASEVARASQRPLQRLHVWDDCGGPNGAGAWQLYDAVSGECTPCAPPQVPDAAIDYALPAHTLAASAQQRVAAALTARLARDGSSAGLQCMATPGTWQAINRLAHGGGHGAAPAAHDEATELRVWSAA